MLGRTGLVIVGVLAFVGAAGCSGDGQPSAAGSAAEPIVDRDELAEPIAALSDWMREHGQGPVEYTCGLFGQADLVFVGEIHEVADSCEFVADLLHPAYHEAGVRVFATEFIGSSLNDELAEVVTGERWDRERAIDLFRAGAWPTWGYAEYVDILEAAWRLNARLPEGAEHLTVVGLDDDWKQIDLLNSDRAERFQLVLARERHMLEVCERETLGAGKKALVHVGLAHAAFVGGERLGSVMKSRHGGRVTHVMLHHSIGSADGVSPITEVLEGALAESGLGRVAFEPAGSPMDAVSDPRTRFAMAAGGDGRLRALAEHYAMLAPLDEQRAVSWIDGFVREDRLAEAIEVLERLRWAERGEIESAADIDRLMRERFAAR